MQQQSKATTTNTM